MSISLLFSVFAFVFIVPGKPVCVPPPPIGCEMVISDPGPGETEANFELILVADGQVAVPEEGFTCTIEVDPSKVEDVLSVFSTYSSVTICCNGSGDLVVTVPPNAGLVVDGQLVVGGGMVILADVTG